MAPITRAVKKRRRGIKRWRCGACLFELAEHVRPLSMDLPHQEAFIPEYVNDSGYADHYIPCNNLSYSAKRGCNVCRSLRQALGHEDDEKGFIIWDHSAVSGGRSGGELHVFFQDEPSQANHSCSHPFVGCGGRPSGNTQSPEAFRKAATWLQRCRDGHQACGKISTGIPMPRRILFIEALAPFSVRLIEDADKLPPQPYVCLSHRWMPETAASSLTRERAETFRKTVPREVFYPLLMDALETTFRLGFQYLWIDCLCIYQDDVQDWHCQASVMSNIYENAALTISALSCDADSDNKRLFSQKAPQDSSELGSSHGNKIRFRPVETYSHPFSIHRLESYSYITPSREFPLTERGWAYQERLLSNRIIHFTERELIWECNQTMWCECRYEERTWERVKSRTTSLADIPWTDLVREYMKTTLSKDSDRLPALSGIAKRYQQSHGGTYLAGLWKEDIMAQLFWVVNDLRATTRPMPRKVPSWSWASVRGFVDFMPCGQLSPRFILHDIVSGPNPFGVPETAKLVLEASFIPATLHYGPGTDSLIDPDLVRPMPDTGVVLKLEDLYLWVSPDYLFTTLGTNHIISGTQVHYMVMDFDLNRVCGLVLLCTDSLAGVYERLGTASYYKTSGMEKLRKACSLKRITLI